MNICLTVNKDNNGGDSNGGDNNDEALFEAGDMERRISQRYVVIVGVVTLFVLLLARTTCDMRFNVVLSDSMRCAGAYLNCGREMY